MFQRIVYWAAFTVAIAAGAAGGHAGFDVVQNLLNRPASVDQVLADIQASPLLGTVIKEYPAAQAQVRAAIEHDQRHPPKDTASQTFLAGLEIRRSYIVPALRKASNEAILAVAAAQADLVRRLQESSLSTCRAFVLVGIEHPERLGRDERLLFDRLLKLTEKAYVSGRRGGRASASIIADDRAGSLLATVGFNMSDFQSLRRLSSLSDAEVCTYGLRLTQAPATIRPDARADLARYLVAR